MKQEPPPPRFPPGRSRMYWSGRSELTIFASEDGSLVLPTIILWAFHLNEGDLVAVSREETETFRYRFRSYGERVWGAAEVCSHPWPWIEEMLRLPMAAVGPRGALLLPEQAGSLAPRPGGPLLLVVHPKPLGEGFTLEPADGRQAASPKLFLHAEYMLSVETGFQVSLPQDVLWALGLQEGDRLACKTCLATADFSPFAQGDPLKGRSLVELGPGGALSLPESLLRVPAVLQPNARIRLEVTFSPQPAFRLTHWVKIE